MHRRADHPRRRRTDSPFNDKSASIIGRNRRAPAPSMARLRERAEVGVDWWTVFCERRISCHRNSVLPGLGSTIISRRRVDLMDPPLARCDRRRHPRALGKPGLSNLSRHPTATRRLPRAVAPNTLQDGGNILVLDTGRSIYASHCHKPDLLIANRLGSGIPDWMWVRTSPRHRQRFDPATRPIPCQVYDELTGVAHGRTYRNLTAAVRITSAQS